MTILQDTLTKTLPEQGRVGQLDTQISKYEKQYQPNMLTDFRRLLQKSSRLAYDQRKSQEKLGFEPSEVSGQTFSSIIGNAEKRRGASVSDIYKTGVYGQVESQQSIGDVLESLRGERETLLTNRTDFIQKLALNSPETLNALGGKGIDSILNGSEITPEMYQTIGDAVQTVVKPTAGELDQAEIDKATQLLTNSGQRDYVSQGYYDQVKAGSTISPTEFDKRFEYLVQDKKGTSGFGVANQIISDSPKATDEELKVALLEARKELGLSVTDINALIDNRTEAAISPEETTKELVESAKGLKAAGYGRSEAAEYIEYVATDNGKTSMPNYYSKALKDAIATVYGKTFFQKVIPGGR